MIGVNGQTMTTKEAILAFLVMFLIQFAFAFNDIIQTMNTETDVSLIIIFKTAFSSLIVTLIFYGYNKISPKKPLEG